MSQESKDSLQHPAECRRSSWGMTGSRCLYYYYPKKGCLSQRNQYIHIYVDIDRYIKTHKYIHKYTQYIHILSETVQTAVLVLFPLSAVYLPYWFSWVYRVWRNVWHHTTVTSTVLTETKTSVVAPVAMSFANPSQKTKWPIDWPPYYDANKVTSSGSDLSVLTLQDRKHYRHSAWQNKLNISECSWNSI